MLYCVRMDVRVPHGPKNPRLFLGILVLALLSIVPAAAGQTVVTHPSQVYSFGMFGAFAFSPDGSRIALAHSSAVSMLNAQTLARLDTFFTTHYGSLGMRYDAAITSIAYSPDGTRLAVAAQVATVFDAATGAVVYTIDSGAGARTVAYSHNGAYLFTGSDGGPADLWNAATGDLLQVGGG